MKMFIFGSYVLMILASCFASEPPARKDVSFFRDIVKSAAQGFIGDKEGVFTNVLRHAQSCNLSQEEAIAEMSALAREYRRISEKSFQGKTAEEEARDYDARRCLRVLQLISCFADRNTLPLFEEMSAASNTWIRLNGYVGYIKVAGVDSFPFIRSSFEKHPALLMEYTVIEEFGRQLKKAKNTSPNKDLSEAYIFLLREVQEGKCRGDILDKVLCENLPEYATSIQREAAAETMMKSSNDYLRNMGNNIKNEIEKTPKEKRKDFKARGELLDPDRGK
jgi:hypothetical protein